MVYPSADTPLRRTARRAYLRCMRGATILALVLAAGCQDVTPEAAPVKCGPRTGPYRSKLTQRDGNCGPISEMVGNALEQPTAPGCTSSLPAPAPEACRVEINSTCPVDAASTIQVTGVLTYAADGVSATGLVQLTLRRNGALYCTGTYDVSVARL